jgi:glycosyltransferase involved in cell wall biosynthesis
LRAVLEDGSIKGEIVIVDDGSTDKTWTVAHDLSTQFGDFVKCVRQRRQAGKAIALQTGFDASSGLVIAVIDADLQYAPEEIPRMLQVLYQGYDVVNGIRDFSKYPRSRRIVSRVYNKMAHLFIGYHGHDLNCGLKVFRREVIESMRLRPGYHRYIVVLAERNGFATGEVGVHLLPRPSGKSNYGAKRILEGAVDLVALRIRFSFEKRPMLLFGVSGLSFIALGLLSGSYLFYQALFGQSISLRPLTLVAVFLVVTGVQFLSLGLISEMLLSVRDDIDAVKVRNDRNR